ncbi:hypothetical protein EDD16DRAFT_1723850 [Pisolithus croceorrhizus]|nr:hypothetical protein EDD16DRAFT_1723850 [Pisolithus croceorrhizus]KAI6133935.1 hypothetical protein EV401DRAFT_1910587 [Pisolithus croceorrhizus]KAI6162883.1 hypothetical protein EDD17DRAFT_1573264 [Pisolithus thermaeus]
MFEKLSRFLRPLLRMLGMAPQPPIIKGLFTGYEVSDFFSTNIEPWFDDIRSNPATWNCSVVGVSYYKMDKGLKHEFLRFDILSPDKAHTSIVIAERTGGSDDDTQPADNIAPVARAVTSPDTTSPDVAGDSTVSNAEESNLHVDEATRTNGKTRQKTRVSRQFAGITKKYPIGARDWASYATLESRAGAVLDQECKKAKRNCTLTFSEENRPSAIQLATLLRVTSRLEPMYSLAHTQCYWFVRTVFGALKRLFQDAKQDIPKHSGGTWNGLPIPMKENMDVVCEKYRDAWAALVEEAAQKRRAEQQEKEEREREREQRRVAEEEREREREQRRAAEEERQRAEERARVAEEEIQREREQRQAAEEANAKLLQELEALRAGIS